MAYNKRVQVEWMPAEWTDIEQSIAIKKWRTSRRALEVNSTTVESEWEGRRGKEMGNAAGWEIGKCLVWCRIAISWRETGKAEVEKGRAWARELEKHVEYIYRGTHCILTELRTDLHYSCQRGVVNIFAVCGRVFPFHSYTFRSFQIENRFCCCFWKYLISLANIYSSATEGNSENGFLLSLIDDSCI